MSGYAILIEDNIGADNRDLLDDALGNK